MLGYVFDDTVLVSLGGGDHGPGALLAALDNRDIRVCIPAVTLSYVFAVLPPQRCVELLGIIEAVPNAAVEPLSDGVRRRWSWRISSSWSRVTHPPLMPWLRRVSKRWRSSPLIEAAGAGWRRSFFRGPVGRVDG